MWINFMGKIRRSRECITEWTLWSRDYYHGLTTLCVYLNTKIIMIDPVLLCYCTVLWILYWKLYCTDTQVLQCDCNHICTDIQGHTYCTCDENILGTQITVSFVYTAFKYCIHAGTVSCCVQYEDTCTL